MPREQERGERKDKDVRGWPGMAWGFLGGEVVWEKGAQEIELGLSKSGGRDTSASFLFICGAY